MLEDDDEYQDEEIFDMEMTDHAADMATKLDALMDILFTFVGTEAQKGEKHREQLFLILMQLFDAFIIKTYKSKYIQFLLFYICSTDIGFIHVCRLSTLIT